MALKPPMIRSGRGRPSIDWGQLYDAWIDSDMDAKGFLEIYGMNVKSGNVAGRIKEWQARANRVTAKIIPAGMASKDLWQVIKEWRLKQGEDDYKTADALRQHVKLVLNKSLRKDVDGKPYSIISNRDMTGISNTLLNIQRIQRLALGMSTENVGLPADQTAQDSMIAMVTDKDAADEIPTFVVEVNKAGKFVRPKPVRQRKAVS